MNVDMIKQVVQNKIDALTARRTHHFNEGDLDIVAGLDTEIAETQDTLNKLNTING